MLLTFLAHYVAQRDGDQHGNDGGHTDADHYQFVVDAAVRFTCARVKFGCWVGSNVYGSVCGEKKFALTTVVVV